MAEGRHLKSCKIQLRSFPSVAHTHTQEKSQRNGGKKGKNKEEIGG